MNEDVQRLCDDAISRIDLVLKKVGKAGAYGSTGQLGARSGLVRAQEGVVD